MDNQFERIPQEKFVFVQKDATLKDQKLETKSRGYFADAMVRFKKNESSVVAAYILLLLAIFSIVSPIISPYGVREMDKRYVNAPPFVESLAEKGWNLFNGAVTHDSQNEASMDYWKGIAMETGHDPLLNIVSKQVKTAKQRGKTVETATYKIQTNKYFENT